MTNEKVIMRFDGGGILADHKIDIEDLVPSLMAVGEICKIANREINGDRASVRVLIDTDIEQGSFEIVVELLQQLGPIRELISDREVATAKELFEWLGIITPAVGASLGLLDLLNWIRGRKVVSKQTIQVEEGGDMVVINIEGDNNQVIISPETNKLLENPEAVKQVKNIVEPVRREGVYKLSFEASNESKSVNIDKDFAENVSNNDPDAFDDVIEEIEPQIYKTHLTVYSPTFDIKSKKWQFKMGDHHVYIDISETTILQDVMDRGGVMVNDLYYVIMEMREFKKKSGRIKHEYKIKEVIKFTPAKERGIQGEL